jgi:hypothetical protein
LEPLHTISYDFDANSRLMHAGDSAAAYDMVFDNLGRANEITADFAGLADPVTLTQAFDANSRRTSLAAAIGATADFENTYSFDALNRMTQIIQQEQSGGKRPENGTFYFFLTRAAAFM